MFDFFNANIAIVMVIITMPFAFYGQVVGLIHKLAPRSTIKQVLLGTQIAAAGTTAGYVALFFMDWKTSAVTYILLSVTSGLLSKKLQTIAVNALLEFKPR